MNIPHLFISVKNLNSLSPDLENIKSHKKMACKILSNIRYAMEIRLQGSWDKAPC